MRTYGMSLARFNQMASNRQDRIVIAGATGFVGSALAARLKCRADSPFEVVGLTRGRQSATGAWDRLISCDLFSLKDIETALEGARYAVYLVHSMLPSARLVQGDFADLDLICADNFARAAKRAGVERIVYLGGLLPSEDKTKLSKHLASRLEVEAALAGQGVPVTVLRAGMVIGPGGSSFEILKRLVCRLPVMLTPAWAENHCQPIDLGTVVALIDHAIDRHPVGTYDVGGPDAPTYREMMKIVGEELGRKRPMVPMPFVSPRMSSRWVSAITGAPRALVRPLIESLRHDMVCRDRRLQAAADLPGLTFRAAVRWCLGADQSVASTGEQPKAYRAAPSTKLAGVRSVQRIPLPGDLDAELAANEYMRWLPRGAWPLLHVEVDDQRTATFSLSFTRKPLLVLTFSPERSTAGRQLFYVKGGLLAQASKRGRLEFRVTPDGQELLTAIHEFAPRLPWHIYRYTQALVHAWVMWRFGRHLLRLARRGAVRTGPAPRLRSPDQSCSPSETGDRPGPDPERRVG